MQTPIKRARLIESVIAKVCVNKTTLSSLQERVEMAPSLRYVIIRNHGDISTSSFDSSMRFSKSSGARGPKGETNV